MGENTKGKTEREGRILMNSVEQWFKQWFNGESANRKPHFVKREKWVLVYIYNTYAKLPNFFLPFIQPDGSFLANVSLHSKHVYMITMYLTPFFTIDYMTIAQ